MRMIEKIQAGAVVTALAGWFGYQFLHPFVSMSEEDWKYLMGFVLLCAVWGCGSSAAYKGQSPLGSFMTFGIALAAGYMAASAPSGPIFAIGLTVTVFAIGYLVAQGKRQRD